MAQYKSPTGLLIEGTLERLSGKALVSDIQDDGTPVYYGETEIWWDEQRTVTRDDKAIFVDEAGEEWTFDQLVKVEGPEIWTGTDFALSEGA